MTRCRAIAVQSSASWRRQRQDLLVDALLGVCRPRSSQTLPPRLETICYAGLKKPLCHKAAWLGSEVFLFHLRQVLPQLSPHCLNGVQIARVRWEVHLYHTALTLNGWLEKETFIRGKSQKVWHSGGVRPGARRSKVTRPQFIFGELSIVFGRVGVSPAIDSEK